VLLGGSGCLSKTGGILGHNGAFADSKKKGLVPFESIAGTIGSPGFEDGPLSAARFNFPANSAVIGADLYVADSHNSAIRRIDMQSGRVVTVVGNGGARGDRDGKGEKALLNIPEGITSDGQFLYIADTFNHAIRRFDLKSGELFTLAGKVGQAGSADGFGEEALFSFPRGVVTDGKAIYVADTINNVIRRIDPKTRGVSTLAGKPGVAGHDDGIGDRARFYFPYGLTINGRTLYIADTLNHSIRRVDVVSGEVLTIAGGLGAYGAMDGMGREARFNSPFDVATDGKMLYVADTLNHAIRRVELETGIVTTLLGKEDNSSVEQEGHQGQEDRLKAPRGITYADPLTLYVADTDNHLIRRINLGVVGAKLDHP
jgi:DNA-binding beta-propeller fold protein YncE